MNKKLLYFVFAALLCLVYGSIFATTPAEQAKGKYYRLLGMQQELNGNFAEAYSLYKHAYEIDPSNKQAGYYYGRTSLFVADSAQFVQAFVLMKDFVDTYPNETQDNLVYAQICAQVDDNDESMRVLKRVLSNNPQDEDVMEKIATLALKMNEPDTALQYVKKLTRLNGDEAQYTPYIISAYMAKNDTAGLIKHIDSKIAAKPASPYYYIIRALLPSLSGHDDAMQFYNMADSIFPNNFNVKHALLSYYEDTGDSLNVQKTMYEVLMCEDADIQDKMDIFTDYVGSLIYENKSTDHADLMIGNLIEQYPYSAEIRNLAAQYYFLKDDRAKSIENIEIAVDMAPENIEYRTLYVQYLTFNGRYEDALRIYEQAVNYDNDKPLLELIAAADYTQTGNTNRAEQVLDDMLDNIMSKVGFENGENPMNMSKSELKILINDDGIDMLAEIFSEKGNLYFKTGNVDDGIKCYEKSIELNETSLSKNNYAYFMAEGGINLDRAEELSKSTIDSDPENPIYLDTYAYILYRKGEYEPALEYIQKAVEQAKKDEYDLSADYFDHYGDILNKIGKHAEALEMWQKALKLEPDNTKISTKIKGAHR